MADDEENPKPDDTERTERVRKLIRSEVKAMHKCPACGQSWTWTGRKCTECGAYLQGEVLRVPDKPKATEDDDDGL